MELYRTPSPLQRLLFSHLASLFQSLEQTAIVLRVTTGDIENSSWELLWITDETLTDHRQESNENM
jgi:hypothetical protein